MGSVPTGSVRKTARGFDSTATEHQRSSKCQTLPGSRRKEFVSMGTSSFRGREAKRLGWERLLESVWGFPDSSLLKMIGKIAEAVRSAGFFPPSDKGGLSLGQISCHTSLKHITIRTGGILMECLTGCAAFRLELNGL